MVDVAAAEKTRSGEDLSKYARATLAFSGITAAYIHLNLANIPQIRAGQNFGGGAELVGQFFLVLGIFQIVFATILAVQYERRLIAMIGIAGFALSILIYFVSTATPLPFDVSQQRLNPFALYTKVFEAIFIINLVPLLKTPR
jgi:hypothetical protein